MEQQLSIITLVVSDLRKSTKFYQSKFGWEKSEHSWEIAYHPFLELDVKGQIK